MRKLKESSWGTFTISLVILILILIISVVIILEFEVPDKIILLVSCFFSILALIYVGTLTTLFQRKSNINQIKREKILRDVGIYSPILGELKGIITQLENFQENIISLEIKKIYQQAEWWQINPDFVEKFNKLELDLRKYNNLWQECYSKCEVYLKEELKSFELKEQKEMPAMVIGMAGEITAYSSKNIFYNILSSNREEMERLLHLNLHDKKVIVNFMNNKYFLNFDEFRKAGLNVFERFIYSREFEKINKIKADLLDFLYNLQRELGNLVRKPWDLSIFRE